MNVYEKIRELLKIDTGSQITFTIHGDGLKIRWSNDHAFVSRILVDEMIVNARFPNLAFMAELEAMVEQIDESS